VEAAEECRKLALAVDPESAEAHGLWSLLEAKRGNLEASVKFGTRAVNLNPDIPSLSYELGNSLQNVGNLGAAAHYLGQAIVIASAGGWEFAGAHKQLSVIYAQQDRREEALASARRAAEIDPDNATFQHHLGNLLQRWGS